MRTLDLRFASLLVTASLVACGSDEATECAPDATQFCTCPHEDGRLLGEQLCAGAGTWGECSCVVLRDGGPPPAPRDGGVVRDAGMRDGGLPLTCVPVKTRPDSECAIVDLVVGSTHTCVLRAYGEVNCFGADDSGQLGRDGVATPAEWTREDLLPVAVSATAIAARADYTCLVDDAQGVWCFGSNAFGKLGTGTTADDLASIARPAPVPNVRAAIDLALGVDHACARDERGVSCWGSNFHGQLGRGIGGDVLKSSPDAQKLDMLGAVDAVACGDGFTCVVDAAGGASCFGRNDEGQLGDTTTNPANAPVAVRLPNGRTGVTVAAGDRHACAVLDDTTVWCWGSNALGQLGLDLRTARSAVPRQVDLDGAALSGVVSLSAAGSVTCARRDDSAVICWGASAPLCDPEGPSVPLVARRVGWFGATARAVAVGDAHLCALRSDRRVHCIGRNTRGESAPGAPNGECEHDEPVMILP